MLVRLMYASRSINSSSVMLESILTTARQHNAECGVTGVLVYGEGVFLQALEGGRSAVSKLYGTIQRDDRHKDVELLSFEEISQRRFGGWTMGLVDVARVNASVLLKYSKRPLLDPYAVSGETSMALLEELIATAAIGTHP